MPTTLPKALDSKTTVYLNGRAKKAARMYAVHDGVSLSQILNELMVEYIEDRSDIAAIEAAKDEPTIPFEDVLKEFGLTHADLHH